VAAAALSKVYATWGGNFAAGACARMYNRFESNRLVGPPSVAFPIGSATDQRGWRWRDGCFSSTRANSMIFDEEPVGRLEQNEKKNIYKYIKPENSMGLVIGGRGGGTAYKNERRVCF